MVFWRSYLRKGAEVLTALMLALMFATFIVQILYRYFFTPIGWSVELITVLWVWVIFIGNAFVVRGRDHVTFDILYLCAPNRIRRIMAFLSAFVISAVFLYSLLPTIEYMEFLRIKQTPLLKIPYNWLFSCYVIFMIAVISFSILKAIEAIRDKLPESPNEQTINHENKNKNGEF